MEQGLVKTNFSLPKWDAKKISGTLMVTIILGALGLVAYIYLLPFILATVWDTIKLCIALPIAGILLYTLTNKKFWRAIGYFSEAMAQFLLGWAIELNPFGILYAQVESAEKDREELLLQTTKLKGQQAKLSNGLQENDKTMRIAAEKIKILKENKVRNPLDEDIDLQLEAIGADFTNAKEYIDSVKPISNDINRLVMFGDKAYRKTGIALEIAKKTITAKKEAFEAVTTGASAMRAAMKAFTGNPDLNNDANKALEVLRIDVANKIGVIKSAIQITSDAMGKQDLNDAAKTRMAADTADQFNIDNQLVYSETVKISATGLDPVQTNTTGGNKYLKFLDKK